MIIQYVMAKVHNNNNYIITIIMVTGGVTPDHGVPPSAVPVSSCLWEPDSHWNVSRDEWACRWVCPKSIVPINYIKVSPIIVIVRRCFFLCKITVINLFVQGFGRIQHKVNTWYLSKRLYEVFDLL